MAIRGLASVTLRRSQHLKHFFFTSRNFIISSQELILHKPGSNGIICKVIGCRIAVGPPRERDGFTIGGLITLFHSNRCLNTVDKCVEPITQTESNAVSDDKKKRKKLKGKRAVVKWLKFFRWKKKKEYERMTAEEKILYKLRKMFVGLALGLV